MATPDEAQQENQPVTRNGGSRPVPDPTFLTDAAIAKAVEALRDYADGQFTVLAERIAGRWALDDERWKAFHLSDARESSDAKEAVKAAISAQKEAAAAQDKSNREAIDKSEKGTAEAIGKLEQLFKTTTDALRDKIDDVKTVANATVQQKVGGTENRTATYALIGVLGTVIAIVIGVVSFALANAR